MTRNAVQEGTRILAGIDRRRGGFPLGPESTDSSIDGGALSAEEMLELDDGARGDRHIAIAAAAGAVGNLAISTNSHAPELPIPRHTQAGPENMLG